MTEREQVKPGAITHILFEELHKLGVLSAIDDFGTERSSFGYLREFNADYLKIAQSFVSMIAIDTLSSHILESIIELSAKLDLWSSRVSTSCKDIYQARPCPVMSSQML